MPGERTDVCGQFDRLLGAHRSCPKVTVGEQRIGEVIECDDRDPVVVARLEIVDRSSGDLDGVGVAQVGECAGEAGQRKSSPPDLTSGVEEVCSPAQESRRAVELSDAPDGAPEGDRTYSHEPFQPGGECASICGLRRGGRLVVLPLVHGDHRNPTEHSGHGFVVAVDVDGQREPSVGFCELTRECERPRHRTDDACPDHRIAVGTEGPLEGSARMFDASTTNEGSTSTANSAIHVASLLSASSTPDADGSCPASRSRA